MLKRLLSGKTMTLLVKSSPTMAGSSETSLEDPLDRLESVRDRLRSVTEEDEETGRFEVSKAGVTASGLPKWAMGLFGVVLALALLVAAVGWAISKTK